MKRARPLWIMEQAGELGALPASSARPGSRSRIAWARTARARTKARPLPGAPFCLPRGTCTGPAASPIADQGSEILHGPGDRERAGLVPGDGRLGMGTGVRAEEKGLRLLPALFGGT